MPIRVNVVISDNGPGFKPEVIDALGEPYVTTRPSGTRKTGDVRASGLGLGFFIAKTLLERSGARLSLENRRFARGMARWFGLYGHVTPTRRACRDEAQRKRRHRGPTRDPPLAYGAGFRMQSKASLVLAARSP